MKKVLFALFLLVLVSACASNSNVDLSSFDRVYFPVNQYKLCPKGKKVLDSQVEVLKLAPDTKILVKGYADQTGTPEYNLTLSEKRAQEVKDYLVSKGVDESKIELEGVGSNESVSEKDEENRTVITLVK